MNKQETFWCETYAEEYIRRNSTFDLDMSIKAWSMMLQRTERIEAVLECGPNIGRNINALNHLLPSARKSIVELGRIPYDQVTKLYEFEYAINSSIVEAELPSNYFDLVFTTGVLIHIAPEELLQNMEKIFSFSKRYILFGEIFSREERTIEYRGQNGLLFARDFGKLFVENFRCRVLDCGFLWGHYYDAAGFDDCTYWLFEKFDAQLLRE